MKRHDGMGRIADQQQAFAVMPLRTVDSAQQSLRDAPRTARPGPESAAERRGTRAAKKSRALRAERASCSKLFGPRAWQEQRRREAAVGIGQRDQHESAARPDVQCVHGQRRLATAAAGMVSSL